MCFYIYIHKYVYIYIYIQREREGERETCKFIITHIFGPDEEGAQCPSLP